jgi:hypothetical protein
VRKIPFEPGSDNRCPNLFKKKENIMTTDNQLLASRLEQLEKNNTELRTEFACERSANLRERRRLRAQAGLAFAALIATVIVSPTSRSAIAQGYGVTLAGLNTRLAAVEAKTQFQSADATAKCTTFSGCNMIVNNGSGNTTAIVTNAAGDGLGNLLIGYNALRGSNQDIRTGSHNLIMGEFNNYSSFGGIVAGAFNMSSGQYASVIGGISNIASGQFASVTGGQSNVASGHGSVVTSGGGNTASGNGASVIGGSSNVASGSNTSVSGGYNNTASNSSASVSGGNSNVATGAFSSIRGGGNITEGATSGWAAGAASTFFHSP